MKGDDTHSSVPLIQFIPHSNSSTPLLYSSSGRLVPATRAVVYDLRPSEYVNSLSRLIVEVWKILKRVHDHVCGRASFGNRRTLLQ